MDAMDIEQEASTATKRKADEPPAHPPGPKSKRLKHGDLVPQTPKSKANTPVQGHEQHQQQPYQQHQETQEGQPTTIPTTTTTSQTTTNHTTLRHEFHLLERELVKRRDFFHMDGNFYENLSSLYEHVSAVVRSEPERSGLNDWVEDTCVLMLEVFMRMEGTKNEIDAIEGRLYAILVELGGWV